MRGMLWLAAGLMIVGSSGCAKKESGSSTAAQPPVVSEEAKSSPGGHGGEGEPVNTAGSTSELVARIHTEESELEQIITSARLKEVHEKAFAIRDLAVATASQAPAAQQAALEAHVGEIRKLADALDEAGDSGDLARTKSEFGELQKHLRAFESVLGAAAR